MRIGIERQSQRNGESGEEAEDEFREPLPDFADLRLLAALGGVNVIGPDIGEDEGPDANENIDENFHRRGRGENPAGLIMDALGAGLGDDQRIRNAARRQRRAVGFHRKAEPGGGNQRLAGQKILRDERQDQNFDHRENHHQRRHQHRHLRPGADGAAGRNRRRDAADRNARGQRRGPFARKAEIFARDEIDHRPIDQIGLDNGRQAAQ